MIGVCTKIWRPFIIFVMSFVCCTFLLRWMSIDTISGHVESDIPNVVASEQTYQINKTVKVTDQPLCTFKVLRDYYKIHHYYPGAGHWDLSGYHGKGGGWDEDLHDWTPVPGRWNSTTHPRFVPDHCTLKYRIYPRSELAKCLVKTHTRSMVTFGDSHGSRYSSALVGFMNMTDFRDAGTCVQEGNEEKIDGGYTPDKQYYARRNQTWSKYLEIKKRDCHSCLSNQCACHVTSGKKSRDINIEYLSQKAIIDTSIKLNNSDWQASTSQEFMFKYFLKDRYPDLLLIFFPFHHCLRKTIDEAIDQLKLLKHLVDNYVPSSTKVFFLPTHHTSKTEQDGAMLALNQALYRILEDDMLQPKTNRYGFLDLQRISKAIPQWVLDHCTHMDGMWYQTMMSIFWETYCNSVTGNQW